MKNRNVRYGILMSLQIIALIVLVSRGIQKTGEIIIAGGLVASTAVTSSMYFNTTTPPRNTGSDQGTRG